MKWNIDRVLVLSPHTDDMELGAGGTVRMIVEAGVEVKSIVFSDCKRSDPKGVLRKECKAAAAHLGIKDITILDKKVGTFPAVREEILQLLYDEREKSKDEKKEFDLIITSWVGDIHQDHKVVAEETIRAFMKNNTAILQYEIPGNCPSFTPNIFVPLSKDQVAQKVDLLNKYESQVERRPYFKENAIKSQVGYHGLRIGQPYAEGFVQYTLSVDSFNRHK